MQRRQFLKNRKVGEDIIGNKIYYTTSDDNLIEFNDGGVISDNSNVNVTLKTRDGDKKVTVFDKPITELNGTFTDLANITMVSIPESVKHISGNAFRNVGLEYVNIDNIGNWCNVSLGSYSHPSYNAKYNFILYSNWKPVTDLIIPDSVTSIGSDAFPGCTGLTSITCNALTPPSIEPFTLYGVYVPIYVPAESVEYYKQDKYWVFENILPI